MNGWQPAGELTGQVDWLGLGVAPPGAEVHLSDDPSELSRCQSRHKAAL